jgi:SAM-dependent methyltransferase
MMIGLRETFEYRRCSTCASLWLPAPPDDLGRYYADDYYSMALPSLSRGRAAPARMRLLLRMPRTLAWWLPGRRGVPQFTAWLAGRGVNLTDRIGDVGSGEGTLLASMARNGFTDLWGFDPYIRGDREHGPIRLRKGDVEDITPGFQLLMFNHSLEHMADPLRAIRTALSKLSPGGRLVVRIPIADSYADRHYGADWVALDPPRHLSIPSEQGMRAVIARAGARLLDVFHDSYALQFWGSEQYRADIPLHDERSVARDSQRFASRDQVRGWEREARRLNRQHRGDSAGFLIDVPGT